jgi:hypothetical protein
MPALELAVISIGIGMSAGARQGLRTSLGKAVLHHDQLLSQLIRINTGCFTAVPIAEGIPFI